MKCKIAKTAGFCGGVRKAFLMVEKEFKGKVNGQRVLIFGSLVHNENVMKIVSGMGIQKIDSLDLVQEGDTVVITAHGVGKDILEEIERRGAEVFNATCPKVSMVQRCARDYFKKGFQVVIFGNKEHKEIKGINGWCENKAIIVADFKEIEKLVNEIGSGKIEKPILFISQTTQNIDNFNKAKKILKDTANEFRVEIEIIDTICRATFVRQKEALELAKEKDTIVVIGGRSSSNTKELWKIVKKENQKSIWIEDPSELNEKMNQEIIAGAKSIGIISGASTSTDDIKEVRKMIENCG